MFAKKTFKQLIRYGLVTILNYLIILGGTYLLVGILKMNPSLGYFTAISFVYIETYILYSVFVFDKHLKINLVKKFLFTLIAFWIVNNLTFNLLVSYLNISYIIAIIFNIFFFGAVRFITYKRWVFNS